MKFNFNCLQQMARNNRNYKEFSFIRLINNFAAFIGYVLIFRGIYNGNLTDELSRIITAVQGIILMLFYNFF